ncbi:hypothetical protein BX616_004054 [Lobosporangium transversale]|uniref:PAS domain-containing protein n=1 Tax=Lobosporangium transversale TaxID=64571 RepID=A0A1Y2GJP2_9FUNG|nr:hypothetical protein BCR41DRAFT_423022 [Lobosporangium transversale]KAF9898422.1 hypothetical protein BX616_004054 [Lobosporangium transversale]ORZ12948.1 hypothetical protein BCR41DRAFT_423022 [Lobosporangium transversale]|eukprot:XP_021880297.1 hypothetical protein BCR41DRAFT_423022 [Lobosporangium transversale]
MFQSLNYISFHDLSPEGRFIWASPSVVDVLGYQPEELVGVPVYAIIPEEDIPLTKTVHLENVLNDLAASQIVLRFKTKDGRLVTCTSVFGLCYDFIFNCATVIDPNAGSYIQMRAHSSAMTRIVGSRKEEFTRMRKHHEAFAASTWNDKGLLPEPRVCMILNRFTRNLIIMYASPATEQIFQLDPDDIIGKPILLFVRADDLGSFVEQIDISKASTTIVHTRFWFQSPNCSQAIPCEAMFFGAADGLIAVMRRCKPFVRRRYIAESAYFSTAHDYQYYQYCCSNSNSNSNNSRCSSWSSAGIDTNAVTAPQSYLHTPISLSPSPSSLHRLSASPVRNVPMSRLRGIRILEIGDERIRPLCIPSNDPSLVPEPSALLHGIKEYHSQEDYIEEDEDEEEEEEEEEEEDDGEDFDHDGDDEFEYEYENEHEHGHGNKYADQLDHHDDEMDYIDRGIGAIDLDHRTWIQSEPSQNRSHPSPPHYSQHHNTYHTPRPHPHP